MANGNQEREANNPLTQSLRASRGAFFAVGLFSFFINALMLTVPLYMLHIYDRVLTSGSESTLWMLTIVAAGLLLTFGLLDMLRARILVRIGARLDNQLNVPLLSAMVQARLSGVKPNQNQPIQDLETVRTFMTGPGLLSLFDSPWTPFFIIVIFLFHPILGFVALTGAMILLLLALVSELVTRGKLKQASTHSVSANGFAESSLRNAEAIQAMGMLPGLIQRWLDGHQSALALQAVASDRAGSITATAKVVRQILQVAMLGVGAYLAIQQIITPGIMIAASIIMGRALAPVEMAIGSWRGFVSARAAFGRLKDVMEQGSLGAERMKLPAPSGELCVENLVTAPPGIKKPVIQNISFRLNKGEVLGLIGPSAAGKSTLARSLVGVWAPLSGRVRLDSADVYQWNPDELGPYIGYLPQDVELFTGSVCDNIARFSEINHERVVAAAKQAGVHEMILRLADGYDTLIGEGGNMLSGGQRQRIALARALYGEPVLVVLDEPNSNLDAEGEEALRAAILGLKAKGTTVVIIAHRPSIITIVDKILVLQEGRVGMFGPPSEVLPHVASVSTDKKNTSQTASVVEERVMG